MKRLSTCLVALAAIAALAATFPGSSQPPDNVDARVNPTPINSPATPEEEMLWAGNDAVMTPKNLGAPDSPVWQSVPIESPSTQYAIAMASFIPASATNNLQATISRHAIQLDNCGVAAAFDPVENYWTQQRLDALPPTNTGNNSPSSPPDTPNANCSNHNVSMSTAPPNYGRLSTNATGELETLQPNTAGLGTTS